jgi:hypothetical protein
LTIAEPLATYQPVICFLQEGNDMAQRITKKDLYAQIELLNQTFGYRTEAWTKGLDGRYYANPNTYVLDCAYGGYRLGQLCNEGGGERDISPRGTARETYYWIKAFMEGINAWHKREAA